MDLLDFEAQDLYFEQEEPAAVTELLKQASGDYAEGEAELPLLKAYFLAPQSLNVLVALNRFYYYQHRLSEALLISASSAIACMRAPAYPLASNSFRAAARMRSSTSADNNTDSMV